MCWKRAAQVLLVGVVLCFLGLNIYHGWRDASRFQWDVRPWPLVASFTLALAFWPMTGLGWNLMVRYLGGNLALRQGMKIYFLSNLGWYVPGKVWHVVGRAYLGQKEGVSVGVISTSVLVETVLSLISSALMAVLALPLLSPLLGAKGLYLGIAAVVVGLAVLHPALMRPVLALLERFLPGPRRTTNPPLGYSVMTRSLTPDRQIRRPGKPNSALRARDPESEAGSGSPGPDLAIQAEQGEELRYSVMLGFLAGYLIIWSFVGTAFFVLLNAVHPLSLAWLPTVIAIYAISWMAGFLAPFAPSGLGVREGAMILLLGQVLPVPAVTVTAILFRLWLILAEVLWAAVATRW
jgi:uncharacterized membrane protein YbhN (UPF0104 family)